MTASIIGGADACILFGVALWDGENEVVSSAVYLAPRLAAWTQGDLHVTKLVRCPNANRRRYRKRTSPLAQADVLEIAVTCLNIEWDWQPKPVGTLCVRVNG